MTNTKREFTGKVAFVTGAANGIGRAAAVAFARKEGGDHINGAFLEAGLVDELSLLIAPGIDGRHDIPAVFDGLSPARANAVPFRQKSVEHRERDMLWIRYERQP